ncbi:FAD-dependent glycerol-3-phosphate dehydrogenase subunit [Planctomycetales bacterium 10988]|nr:FAD-dependent glycerol-3-phosphate dehydrogenase subunit [Planctomycetales bacterium 10988]
MNRESVLSTIRERKTPWDMVFIGGGATGVGGALDAAARGYEVLLLEQHDFGKGTSSRSTKLVHGGVRYLQQGNIPLVMEALKERGILLQNAPHLVNDLAFVVPNYSWWEAPFYGIGMKVYDLLAGKYKFGHSKHLSVEETLERIPNLKTEGLRGGVLYHDGQFDDARLLLSLVRTAAAQGASLLNYCKATSLVKDAQGFLTGLEAEDQETGELFAIDAKVIANCTGPFSDAVRRKDDPNCEMMIRPSTGVHLVFDKSFLAGETAIMVPHTTDGRVLFAIPWHDHVLVGTTDQSIETPTLEPKATAEEIDFILENAQQYLSRDPQKEDILSIFCGIRPLVGKGKDSTSKISRDHTITISQSGLVSIAGGKWTTYRNMAADLVDHLETLADFDNRPCPTAKLKLDGAPEKKDPSSAFSSYGTHAPALQDLIDSKPEYAQPLHADLPYLQGEVIWGARHDYARSVEDILARRLRALFLHARAASESAPKVAQLLAEELNQDKTWQTNQVESFQTLAKQYLPF